MGMTRKDYELVAWCINRASDKAIHNEYCAEGTRDEIIELLGEAFASQHPRFDVLKFRRASGHSKEWRAIAKAKLVASLTSESADDLINEEQETSYTIEQEYRDKRIEAGFEDSVPDLIATHFPQLLTPRLVDQVLPL